MAISDDAPLFDVAAADPPKPQDSATPPPSDNGAGGPVAAGTPGIPAWAETLGSRIVDALDRRQDPATSTQSAPQMPATWWETLNDEQRKQVNAQALIDNAATNAFIAQQESEYSRRRMIQDAAPIVAGQAQMFVDIFKSRQQRNPYAGQIEPLFDRRMQGIDLRPLVNMSASTRDAELQMRWDAAEAEVLKQVLKNPPKADPTLTVATGPSTPVPSVTEGDPWMRKMDSEFKYTPEQKAALEAANKAG